MSKATAIQADDTIYPDGRDRLTQQIADDLAKANSSGAEAAENYSFFQEIALENTLLAHDESNDVAIRAKLGNYFANLSPNDAQSKMHDLARDTEFSTFLAGSEGESLAARYSVDHKAIKAAAVKALTKNGNAKQRALGNALAIAPGQSYRAKMLSQTTNNDAVKAIRAMRATAKRAGFGDPGDGLRY